ncbi:HAD family hydrolase [Lysinibacillus macroides]|uniref:HAD family hydrolase n=1 Tax=Lysinibacillus macroides TaxID=33935 RepID=A0A0N0CWC6_9BACI|nr:HAD family hydrolase [Lysinibacillus macroides]KOY82921.1 HAD family hydrolase [Lysinibacillus macroides]
MSIDSIIFDLDGTLWDSRKTVAKSWTKIVQESPLGKGSVTEEDLSKTMGLQIKEIAAMLFHYLNEQQQLELILACCQQEQIDLLREGGILYPQLEETLVALSARFRMFIVSNCQEGYIETFYDYHQLGKYFLDFENPGRTGLSKGENIQLIMERNNIKNAVYVGDTNGDMLAAQFAGIPFVYASYGFGQPEQYDYVIEQPSDLLTLF